jgi:glucose dehydrogenase
MRRANGRQQKFTVSLGGLNMKSQQRWILLVAATSTATLASAADVEQVMSKSSNWAAQAGDYANHRYSELKQINASNVGRMQVAWTMSTGVLRGHEGSPLVIGETMYIHTPFPNNVYAVNLKDQSYKWKYEPKQDVGASFSGTPIQVCVRGSRVAQR